MSFNLGLSARFLSLILLFLCVTHICTTERNRSRLINDSHHFIGSMAFAILNNKYHGA